MKKLIILFTATLVFFSVKIQSQTIETCTNDSIKLNAENHQFGTLEWEISFNNINWEKLQNENNSTYKFKPSKAAYYRVVNKFPNCEPNISSVTFVQRPPVANVGNDRLVNDTSLFLAGNSAIGSTGTWSILEGNGGAIAEPNNPNSKFTGTTGDYKLLWTLQNTCGVSSDTLKVKFINNQYKNKIVIVDNTDIILSSPTDLANGNYNIQFSTPVPVIDNETILVGQVGNGFLRKVKTVSQNGNTFTMTTSQGKLKDLLIDGGFELGNVFKMDSILPTTKMSNYKILKHIPTRAEILSKPELQKGIHYFVVNEKTNSAAKGIQMRKSFSIDNPENPVFELTFNNTLIDEKGFNIKLEGGMKFTPNVFVDYKTNLLNTTFSAGIKNSTLVSDYKFTMQHTSSTSLIDKEFSIYDYSKVIYFLVGGVPVLVNANVKFEGNARAAVDTDISFVHHFVNTITTNAGITLDNGQWTPYYTDKIETTVDNNLNLSGSLTQNFEIGPKISFKVYDVIGPYIDAKLTEDLNICASTVNVGALNWNATLNLGGKFTVGAIAEALDYTFFDYSKTWEDRELYTVKFPYRIEFISGNHQQFAVGQSLITPAKVRVMSNKGFAVPGVVVKFEPFFGNGTVQTTYVITDLNGYAQTLWTPTATNGLAKMKAIVQDCDQNNITDSPLIFEANEITNIDCTKTTLYASYIKNGNTLTPVAHLGVKPYTYSTDFVNFSSNIPTLTLTTGGNYQVAIMDANGCVAYMHYYNRPFTCNDSGLNLQTSIYGNSLVATAQGGILPYLFALDNGIYGSSNTYTNLTAGKHLIRIKDGNDCVRQTIINITNSTNNLVAYFELASTISANQPILFNNLSTNATSYSWDFGNGQISTATNPNIVYICNGSYVITLTAYNAGVSKTFSRTITITDGQSSCTVTDIEGNVYNVVTVGSQKWMKENLKVWKLNDGTIIKDGSSKVNWVGNEPAHSYLPTILSPTYGNNYNWQAVNTNKLCPTGWRVPNNSDWQDLIDYMILEGNPNQNITNGAGNALKSCLQVNSPSSECNVTSHPRWDSNSNRGLNKYLFNALPAGRTDQEGGFGNYGKDSYWWSSDQNNATTAIVFGTTYNTGNIQMLSASKSAGMSVRCIKE